jgi:4-hydroxybenzoate polyprenyltransferase
VRPRTLLELGRVSNLPTVWSNVVVAFAIAAGQGPRFGLPLVASVASGTALYVAGMFLNDAFDADVDARERPARPIPSGRASRRSVFFIGYALLAFGVLVSLIPALSTPGPGLAVLGASSATAAFVWAYDRVHERFAWSPLLMGACRAGLYAMGALSAAAALPAKVAWLALGLFAYVVGLTHVARFETGSSLQRSWVLGALALPSLVQCWLGVYSFVDAAPWWLVHLGWVAFSLGRLRSKAAGRIGKTVVSLIAGISLVDALFAGAAGHGGVALFSLGCFGLTLFLQRWVSGT